MLRVIRLSTEHKAVNNRTTILDSLPNNQAGFQWQVFSISRSDKIEVDCDMDVTRVRAQPEAEPEEAEETTVLVLNSYGGSWQPAVLISEAGSQEELTCFEKDDNSGAFWSCSVNWENQLHIFGGYSSA